MTGNNPLAILSNSSLIYDTFFKYRLFVQAGDIGRVLELLDIGEDLIDQEDYETNKNEPQFVEESADSAESVSVQHEDNSEVNTKIEMIRIFAVLIFFGHLSRYFCRIKQLNKNKFLPILIGFGILWVIFYTVVIFLIISESEYISLIIKKITTV